MFLIISEIYLFLFRTQSSPPYGKDRTNKRIHFTIFKKKINLPLLFLSGYIFNPESSGVFYYIVSPPVYLDIFSTQNLLGRSVLGN